jgi:exodeoxyribonuclease VII large subunit
MEAMPPKKAAPKNDLPLFNWAVAQDGPTSDSEILSVSEVNLLVKDRIENDDRLGLPITVQAELSNVKIASSGHVYFTLKDDSASMSAIMWSSTRKSLAFALENGLEVLATGNLQVYAANGSVSLICKKVIPAGWGSLQLALEALKQKLAAEGLFDEGRKQLLPPHPNRIGVVTARTGAVIHDMLRVIHRKAPHVSVLLYPVAVQGENAPLQIANAIQELNRPEYELDLLIVGRGGGSFEDLFCFNDERVVRAIADSDLPIITGIGHEPDFSLSDAVADVFASTPTAAAERAVPDAEDLLHSFEQLKGHFAAMLERAVLMTEKRLDEAIEALPTLLNDLLGHLAYQLEKQAHSMDRSMQQQLYQLDSHIKASAASLDALSPLKTLGRGYSISTLASGELLQTIDAQKQHLSKGSLLKTQVTDGMIYSEITHYEQK